MPQVLSTELTFELNQEYSFNNIPFWYKSEIQRREWISFSTERRDRKKGREKPSAFPLYVSQQCSTEFLPKVWTHKTAPVPLSKLWHHDWDRSVTSTSIWPVQQILDHFLINTVWSESTLQIKQHESHSMNSTQALTGQQIYGECFPYIIIDHIFTSPGIDRESG